MYSSVVSVREVSGSIPSQWQKNALVRWFREFKNIPKIVPPKNNIQKTHFKDSFPEIYNTYLTSLFKTTWKPIRYGDLGTPIWTSKLMNFQNGTFFVKLNIVVMIVCIWGPVLKPMNTEKHAWTMNVLSVVLYSLIKLKPRIILSVGHFPPWYVSPLELNAPVLYWADLPCPMLSATFTDSASDFVPPVLAQGLCTIPRFDPDKKPPPPPQRTRDYTVGATWL